MNTGDDTALIRRESQNKFFNIYAPKAEAVLRFVAKLWKAKEELPPYKRGILGRVFSLNDNRPAHRYVIIVTPPQKRFISAELSPYPCGTLELYLWHGASVDFEIDGAPILPDFSQVAMRGHIEIQLDGVGQRFIYIDRITDEQQEFGRFEIFASTLEQIGKRGDCIHKRDSV
ncbi:MAG: hypothetical protein D6712_21215 [Chloroflexi bacterium]|nr:MAG: hypothetical protein D6712_21215 [Chloroflexota bacterium]